MDEGHPFATLAGRWRGRGEGSYPTVEDFAYTEELVVEPVPGRPLAHWRSRTRNVRTGEPSHAEAGFLRATPAGTELVIAHGSGVVETACGSFDGVVLTLASETVRGTPTAKQVDRIERRYELDGEVLRGTLAMAAVGVGLTHHLRATLRRVPYGLGEQPADEAAT